MDFNKIGLVLHREYMTRVRTKAFLISTLLAPIIMIALIGIPVLLSFLDTDKARVIGVDDRTGTVFARLLEQDSTRYRQLDPAPADSFRAMVLDGRLNGYLTITDAHLADSAAVEFLSDGTGGLSLFSDVRADVRAALRDERLRRADVSEQVKAILAQRTEMVSRKVTLEGEEEQDTLGLFAVGYIMTFIIYGAMFGYGAIIMRGVIEEKSNRIVEVITSSVRPFELLMGKVLGVGAVGLTQFTLWAVSSALIMAVAGMVMGGAATPDAAQSAEAVQAAADSGFSMPTIGIGLWVAFVLFFLGGYLIYSALFAAVGSAVDNETETQQLMLPITLPIIIPLLLIGPIASDPNSNLAVVASMIPFFAPMLMPLRLAMTDVPIWQVATVAVLIIGTFAGLIWTAARIYRVGILMYGKKAGFREMARWIRYS